MARPIEKSIEYYPMNCNFLNDIKIRRIIKACGASSIAILLHLLGNIYGDEGYYLKWNEDVSFLISDSLGVNEGLVNEVIKKAIQVDFFDEHLFNKFKILSSKGIQNRYLKATEKRKNEHLNNDYLLVNIDSTIVSSEKTRVNDTKTTVNIPVSTQSKVKESKVKQINTHNNKYDDNGGDDLDFAYPKKDACEYGVSKASEVEAYFIQEVKGCPCSPGEQIAITKALKDFSMEDIKAGIDAVKGRGISSFKYVLSMLDGQKRDAERARKMGVPVKNKQTTLQETRYSKDDMDKLIAKKLAQSRGIS